MDISHQQSGAHDFDFLLGSWSVRNRRKRRGARWPVPASQQEIEWEEFVGHDRFELQLDGRAIVEYWQATLSSGEPLLGLSIKAFEPATQCWSIVWIDNRNPLDFQPLVGRFTDGVGTLYQILETPGGRSVRVRYVWEQSSALSARWQQAFSFDGGGQWEIDWVFDAGA